MGMAQASGSQVDLGLWRWTWGIFLIDPEHQRENYCLSARARIIDFSFRIQVSNVKGHVGLMRLLGVPSDNNDRYGKKQSLFIVW